MKKTILFPFDIKIANRLGYCKAIQLAQQEQAKLICFTVLTADEYPEKIDEVYIHLLHLQGYYQTYINRWSKTSITIQNIILCGNKTTFLKQIIKDQQPNWIISHSGTTTFNYLAIANALPMPHECKVLPVIITTK